MVTGLLTRQEDITSLERHAIIQDLAETPEMRRPLSLLDQLPKILT